MNSSELLTFDLIFYGADSRSAGGTERLPAIRLAGGGYRRHHGFYFMACRFVFALANRVWLRAVEVRWLLSVAADLMVVMIFCRILLNDLKDFIFKKVRKSRGLE